ncbi:hypothetical protein [Mycoplasma sp. P36-A1]|uniref:hypothetical protein n=1 Tax=Mycoplasma sp. P36-A1 TaxID=3252900 RepID=UPI003C2C9648
MKLFLDVDNTILEHSGFYSLSTEGRIHSSISQYPFENEKAINMMYDSSVCRNPDVVKELFYSDDVYILTKYASIEYEVGKQKRIADLFGVSVEELNNLKDDNGINKYICLDNNESKVDIVYELFQIDNLNDCILLDDYSTNLIEWQNNGGIAIKYYNEYNSPNHPTRGISISNFDFFKPLISKQPYKNLMIVCENTFKLQYFSKMMEEYFDLNKVEIIKLVLNDLADKFNFSKQHFKQKYDIKNFIVEYYYFINAFDQNYWHNYFIANLGRNLENALICSSFDMDLRKINIADKSLGLKIIDKENKPSSYIFDIYLTVDGYTYIEDVHETMSELANTIGHFVLGKERK